jgi:glutathione synthase
MSVSAGSARSPRVLWITTSRSELTCQDTTRGLIGACSEIAETWFTSATEIHASDGHVVVDATHSSQLDDIAQDRVDWRMHDFTHVAVRMDPPVDDLYLERLRLIMLGAQASGVAIYNEPSVLLGIVERYAPELGKEYPSSIVTADPARIRDFVRREGTVIAKSLSGCNGHGVTLLGPEPPTEEQTRLATNGFQRPLVLQRLVQCRSSDEIRAWFVDGRLLAVVGKSRVAQRFSFETAHGDRLDLTEPEAARQQQLARVGSKLRDWGVWFAAADFVGEYLVDLNVTSPGLLVEAEALLGRRLAPDVVAAMVSRLP